MSHGTSRQDRPLLRPTLLPEALGRKHFRVVWRGYDRREVDEFLHEVSEAYSTAIAAAATEAAILRLRLVEAERRAATPRRDDHDG